MNGWRLVWLLNLKSPRGRVDAILNVAGGPVGGLATQLALVHKVLVCSGYLRSLVCQPQAVKLGVVWPILWAIVLSLLHRTHPLQWMVDMDVTVWAVALRMGHFPKECFNCWLWRPNGFLPGLDHTDDTKAILWTANLQLDLRAANTPTLLNLTLTVQYLVIITVENWQRC